MVAVIVETGIALVVDAEAEVGGAGTGDEKAEIGREDDVGERTGNVVAFEAAAVERDHEAAAGDCGVGGEVNLGRGADVEAAAARQLEMRGLVAGGDGLVVADDGKAVGDDPGPASETPSVATVASDAAAVDGGADS